MHVKITMRYHHTFTRMAKIKMTDITKCWWGCGATGTLTLCWGCANWFNHFGKLKTKINYSWHLNNTGLNCVDPLKNRRIFFDRKYYSTKRSVVGWIRGCRNVDAEKLQIQRAYYKLCVNFWLHGGWVPLLPSLFKGQLYTSPLVPVSSCLGVYPREMSAPQKTHRSAHTSFIQNNPKLETTHLCIDRRAEK